MKRQQTEFYKLFSEHGSGEAKICISPQEIVMLVHIAANDLHIKIDINDINEGIARIASKGFFEISQNDVENLPIITKDDCFSFMDTYFVTNINHVMFIYVKNLCDLYRRRFKYHHILKNQPFPNSDQIVPRSLLEYGNCSNKLLADWLEWRKWIFDIDNRSAQETGYIFEPILASCLGGTPMSAKNSPVKRIDDNGDITQNGKQIDCYIEDRNEVYELKMRVTIAASGQGRFNEEMSFPYEAQRAGLKPILVVFDENSSTLLTKLKQRYKDCGGEYYIGKDAWEMLKNRAGFEMGIFINNYIYPPISAMEKHLNGNPQTITLNKDKDKITIKGNGGEYTIERNNNA